MCADSLVSLFPVVFGYVKEVIGTNLGGSSYSDFKEDNECETADRLVPQSWVLIGWSISVILGTFLVWIVFGHEGIKPWATFLGFVLGMLSILAYVNLLLIEYFANQALQSTRPRRNGY